MEPKLEEDEAIGTNVSSNITESLFTTDSYASKLRATADYILGSYMVIIGEYHYDLQGTYCKIPFKWPWVS